MMKKALIKGYYGMKNTGDDALMAVTSWGVKKYLKAESIYALAQDVPTFNGSGHVLPVLKPKQKFRGENRIRKYLAALKSDGIIFGGGSIFHSSNGIKQGIKLLKICGKNSHAALGVGIGPFRDSDAEKYCAELLNRLSFVGLRDNNSYEIVKSIAPDIRSEKTFDLAPLLPQVARLSTDKLGISSERKGVGFALCGYEKFVGSDFRKEEIRFKKIIELLKIIKPAEVEEIVLIDFNGHNVYGDKSLNDKIESKISHRFKVKRIYYLSNPIETLRIIAGLRVIVAMRLHAAVFGYLTQTPTLMFSYHPKCKEWASDIKMYSGYIFDSVDFDIELVANYIRQGIFEELIKPKVALKDVELLAMKNWTWIG